MFCLEIKRIKGPALMMYQKDREYEMKKKEAEKILASINEEKKNGNNNMEKGNHDRKRKAVESLSDWSDN